MPERRSRRVRLPLDADTSRRALLTALSDRGHDVTRTPCEWMALDAEDRTQLDEATARGRAIFTFNIRDFVSLHASDPGHCGIVLAAQRRWTLSQLVGALDHFLSTAEPKAVRGQLIWLRSVETER